MRERRSPRVHLRPAGVPAQVERVHVVQPRVREALHRVAAENHHTVMHAVTHRGVSGSSAGPVSGGGNPPPDLRSPQIQGPQVVDKSPGAVPRPIEEDHPVVRRVIRQARILPQPARRIGGLERLPRGRVRQIDRQDVAGKRVQPDVSSTDEQHAVRRVVIDRIVLRATRRQRSRRVQARTRSSWKARAPRRRWRCRNSPPRSRPP